MLGNYIYRKEKRTDSQDILSIWYRINNIVWRTTYYATNSNKNKHVTEEIPTCYRTEKGKKISYVS